MNKLLRNNAKFTKKFLKELLPPFIIKELRLRGNIRGISSIFPVYENYESAMKDASGYEDKILTKVLAHKGMQFAQKIKKERQLDLMSLRTLIGVSSSISSKKLRVIDFGGAAGEHYHEARSIIPSEVDLDWRVIETKTLVENVKELGMENSELKFYDSIKQATDQQKFDLVFASGSIHCTQYPYETLKELNEINSSKFFITRLPITDNEVVVLQKSTLSSNGPGKIPDYLDIPDKVISYPATMMSKQKTEDILNQNGSILLKIRENKSAYITKKETYDFWGYIVTKDNI
jgi:putative methyltransferase (TIGR04325 family)